MNNIIVPWKHCVFDMVKSHSDESISFFHAADIEKSELDIQIEEKYLVETLSNLFKEFLLDLFEVDASWKIMSHVVDPFTTRDQVPGDVDLLIYNPEYPDSSIAIEVKIFKKKQENFCNDFVSNINRIRKGLCQAEGLQKMGFSSVFFMPIIVANTSILEHRNLASRTVDESNWGKIVNEFLACKKEREIGLMALEICQNTAKPFIESGSVSGFMYFKYKANQNSCITDKIRLLG